MTAKKRVAGRRAKPATKPEKPTLHLFACVHKEGRKWPYARCPMKMVRYLAGTTLLDIFARKFHVLAQNPMFKTAWIEVPIREAEQDTWRTVRDCGAPVKRPKGAHYSTLRETDADFVVWVNPCLPFLKVGTVLEACNAFLAEWPNCTGLTTVTRDQDWFWDEDGKSVTIPGADKIRLQQARLLWRTTHALHIYSRKYKIETGGYWPMDRCSLDPMKGAHGDPVLFEMTDEKECLDVDSELDFQMVAGLMELENMRAQ